MCRTENPRKRVAFEKENIDAVPATPANMKPPKITVSARKSSNRTPGPGVTRERRTNSSNIEVNGKSYEIFEKLGQGGFSKVYKCVDAETKVGLYILYNA